MCPCWPYWMLGFQLPMRKVADEDFEARLLVDFVRYFGLSLDLRECSRPPSKGRTVDPRAGAGEERRPDALRILKFLRHSRFIELCKADFRATRNYDCVAIPGRITFSRPVRSLRAASPDPTLGWS